jgi:co-chaperonin GroES (HSP10)
MAKTYKEKLPTLEAIEFTSAANQSGEVANLIGALSYTTDVSSKKTSFKVGDQVYTATEGQVIAIQGDAITVLDGADFYAKYELVL